MNIRKAKKSDWKTIAKFMKQEFIKPPYKEKWTMKTALDTINHYSEIKSKIFVAEQDKTLTGFILFRIEYYNDGRSAIIEELVVSSKFQRQGIGKALIKTAEDYCKKEKVKTIYLTTSIDAHAFKFYKKMKYKPSKKTVFLMKKLK